MHEVKEDGDGPRDFEYSEPMAYPSKVDDYNASCYLEVQFINNESRRSLILLVLFPIAFFYTRD